jgi:hypothetical protein
MRAKQYLSFSFFLLWASEMLLARLLDWQRKLFIFPYSCAVDSFVGFLCSTFVGSNGIFQDRKGKKTTLLLGLLMAFAD